MSCFFLRLYDSGIYIASLGSRPSFFVLPMMAKSNICSAGYRGRYPQMQQRWSHKKLKLRNVTGEFIAQYLYHYLNPTSFGDIPVLPAIAQVASSNQSAVVELCKAIRHARNAERVKSTDMVNKTFRFWKTIMRYLKRLRCFYCVDTSEWISNIVTTP